MYEYSALYHFLWYIWHMRINKFIAQAGVASRRKADELIAEGKVKINGAVLKEPGYDVKDEDSVEVLGNLISKPQAMVYYALNKPAGFVCTLSDEKGRPTVVSLLTDVTARVYPVGRLDYDSRGLLILTNDGTLAQHISHPKNKVWKTYVARVNGTLKQAEVWQLFRASRSPCDHRKRHCEDERSRNQGQHRGF